MNRSPIQIFAHRGFSGLYPENTMAAFEAALQLDVAGIELDVHMTRDGKLVVIHDESLERTTNGHGQVKNHTLAELKQLDAGGWFAKRYAGERIPTLEEVVDLVTRTRPQASLNIELKTDVFQYPGIEEAAWQTVARRGLGTHTIFSSFHHATLHNLKSLYPSAHTALLYDEELVAPVDYASRLSADALHPSVRCVDEGLVRSAHQRGLRVRVYTVNSVEVLSQLCALGVDAVFTDHPDTVRRD